MAMLLMVVLKPVATTMAGNVLMVASAVLYVMTAAMVAVVAANVLLVVTTVQERVVDSANVLLLVSAMLVAMVAAVAAVAAANQHGLHLQQPFTAFTSNSPSATQSDVQYISKVDLSPVSSLH
eukprot:jgi/Phyca11/14746/fgenesh1_pg.PHYCAscaffold_9_\